MDGSAGLTFKVASEDWELERIHRLNYRTFVDEIPQHHGNDRGVLVDRFHEQNVYLVCVRGDELLGMLALRCARPFSLDGKLEDLESYLPSGGERRMVECRLLAAEKQHRGGRVFVGLIAEAGRYLIRHGYDFAVISGTTRQLKLYRHMGFVAFGPLVGTPGAMYQPMYLTRARFEEMARALEVRLEEQTQPVGEVVSFLPGPVDVSEEVRAAFVAAPVSHRAETFLADFHETRAALCRLVNARDVQVLSGSGTLANDVIAARLSLEGSRGLVLNNGEFGGRLVDHARRAGLDFSEVRRAWGAGFELDDVAAALRADGRVTWVWAVHCETSSGVLNDLEGLKAMCASRGVKLCLDCISSIGTVPVALAGVFLASGISGKGLRAYPGLSLVFHDRLPAPAPGRLPRYLDLGFYAEKGGVPFTVCSNLLYALKAAVEQLKPAERFAGMRRHAEHVRAGLAEMGLAVVASVEDASPAVVTIALPAEACGTAVGDAVAGEGFLLSCRSDYLIERNWVQVCLMGEYSTETVGRMLAAVGRRAARARVGSRLRGSGRLVL